MNLQTAEISSPVAKTVTAWVSTGTAFGVNSVAQSMGFTSWAEVAHFFGAISAIFATLLTASYLLEFWWKRMWRPLFVLFGWVKPLPVAKAE
jgi:hypothetical protein